MSPDQVNEIFGSTFFMVLTAYLIGVGIGLIVKVIKSAVE